MAERTLAFRFDKPGAFTFKAGQYINLMLVGRRNLLDFTRAGDRGRTGDVQLGKAVSGLVGQGFFGGASETG